MQTIAEINLCNEQNLTDLYRRYVGDYPKFFKMDGLSKLGFVATEMLLKENQLKLEENCCIIFGGKQGCISNDKNFQTTIDKNNYFPSPSLFVYTLPNIVTGELAIRNKVYGETMFYFLENEEQLLKLTELTISKNHCKQALCGFVDYISENNYKAHLILFEN